MPDGLSIAVHVTPRASKSEVVGLVGGQLKVKVTSPPVDGAANAELIRLLSRYFDVAKRNIELISGETSRIQKVRISGLKEQQIQAFLNGSF